MYLVSKTSSGQDTATINPLYSGGLFHCYVLDESINYYSPWKVLLTNNVDPDQMPQYVASDLGLHCLCITLYGYPGKNGLKSSYHNSIDSQEILKKQGLPFSAPQFQ